MENTLLLLWMLILLGVLRAISGICFSCSLYQTLLRADSQILRFEIEKPTDPLRFEEVEKSDNIQERGKSKLDLPKY